MLKKEKHMTVYSLSNEANTQIATKIIENIIICHVSSTVDTVQKKRV